MKNKIGIWIDKSKAIIVSLNDTDTNVKEITAASVHENGSKLVIINDAYHENKALHKEKKGTNKNKNAFEKYIKKVASTLKDAEEVYLFGPADTKNSLRNYLVTHLSTFNFKLKSNESTDTLAIKQVVARVKNYFKYNLA